jgi:hypothetical protein
MPDGTILTPPLPGSTESNEPGGVTPPVVDPPADPNAPPVTPPADPNAPPAEPPKTPEGAPEKYEFKLPDGVELDQALIDEVTPVFKELNLTQEQAQKLVDLQARNMQRVNESIAKQFTDTVQAWAESTKKDPEFAGVDYEKKIGIAVKGITAHGTPELRKLMDETGIGNHPEMIRMFYKLGLEVKEPSLVDGPPKNTTPADKAKLFYGSVD